MRSPLLNHGLLLLDKPTGISSAAAVAQVKRLTRCPKVGHGGTLDPFASGLLPVLLGEATKLFDALAGATKHYECLVAFGEERDTDDREGQVTRSSDVMPAQEEIQALLPQFTGRIWQTPPVYSALKQGGIPAYAKARAGETVVMTPREVQVDAMELLAYHASEHTARLRVACGKGTYIRALARDVGRAAGSACHLQALRRTRIGKFEAAHAISLDKLAGYVHNPARSGKPPAHDEAFFPIGLALDDIPAIDMEDIHARQIRQGQAIALALPNGRHRLFSQGVFLALAEADNGVLRPLRVFNLPSPNKDTNDVDYA